jgi:hypothetical protein
VIKLQDDNLILAPQQDNKNWGIDVGIGQKGHANI